MVVHWLGQVIRGHGKESEKDGVWKEKEGKAEKEIGGLYQGGYGGSGSDGGGGTGSSKMEEETVELGKARRRRRGRRVCFGDSVIF